ncbi:MAG: hypothetical protein K5657_10070 [Desulfovibrio sp.]|nr:hypothetical protein [Desulfovibrio sp.]
MEIQFTEAFDKTIDRIYGIDAVLRNFKGCQHLEVTLIRMGHTEEELNHLKELMAKGVDLVDEENPEVPKEVLKEATVDAALSCILENFTREEVDQFIPYVKKRYSDLIEKLIIAPTPLPVPLGAGSIGLLPTTRESGFIKFEKAPDYPLPFVVHAYFNFSLQDELSGDQS